MITSAQSFVTFAVACLWLAANAVADVAVRTALQPSQILPGERAQLEVRIDAESLRAEANRHGGNFQSLEDLTGAIDKSDDLFMRSEKLKILDERFEKLGADLVWSYAVTVYEPGKFRIPPIQIKIGGMTLSSEAMTFTAVATRDESNLEMHPNYEEEKAPLPWTWLFVAVLLAAIGFLATRMFELRPGETSPEEKENPEDWLRRRLSEIEMRSVGDTDRAIDELGYAMREYLTRRTGYSVIGWTTVEFSRSSLYGAPTSSAHRWLAASDLHKFARAPLESTDFVQQGLSAARTLLDRHRELC